MNNTFLTRRVTRLSKVAILGLTLLTGNPSEFRQILDGAEKIRHE